MFVQLLVHERTFHQTLAVVEDPVHLNGRDVLSQRGELTLLDRTDFTLGVEHVDMDALYSQEAVGHGRTCVAARGDKDIDFVGLG